MKKINFLKISNYLKMLSFALITSTFFIPLATGISMHTGKISRPYGNAYSFFFGMNVISNTIKYENSKLSIIGLLAFVFLCISFTTLLSSFILHKKKELSAILSFTSVLSLLTLGIFALCSHYSLASVLTEVITHSTSENVINTIYNNTSVGFGVWGMSLFSFTSVICLSFALLFDGSFDRLRARLGLI